MPAASYREGPDGHSSRKQNSKRRRAKCSPSFVSGRVIGHGDISPRCIPECSAMALHRAVPAARPSRASTLSFVLLAGAFSKSCLRCRFFCGEGGSYLVRGESRRSSMARSSRMRSRATGSGNILARCVLEVLPRQDSAAVRSRASIRGKFCAPCIPKVASDGKIASSRQDSRAMHPKTGSLWQDLRAMHPKSPANRLSRTHGAQILPGRPPFRCTGPSNHARRADLAVRRSVKPPERPQHRCRRTARAAKARSHDPRNTAQEAAPPVASWAASTANSSRATATAFCQHQPVACRPANNSVIADSASCGDNIHVATAPPIRRAALAQREGYLPYLWRLSSVLLADAIGL